MTVFYRRFWFITALFMLLLVRPVFASGFIVQHIRVQGNQRVSPAAVLSYVPVHIGQTFDSQQSSAILNSLYKSGYFSNIKLLRSGNTLIVRVHELPIISKMSLSGNKAISKKHLMPALKALNLEVGDVYHYEKLNEFKMGLEDAYRNMGRYNVSIDTQIKKMPYNTIALNIVIKEGHIAKVRHIEILGNHAFSEHTLKDQFRLTTPGLFTLLSHRDRYSPMQLSKDVSNLTNFYYNHGYLDFKIVSKKVTVLPNHKGVKILVRIHEGAVYRISGYRVSGKYANNSKIHDMIGIKTGEVFSRKKLVRINADIANYFANTGYAFPKINAKPTLNRAKLTVFLTFEVKPGKRVYIRQIHFLGNQRTEDKVLRTQMRQLEGSVYSLRNIKESKRRLANLPYLKDIKAIPVPVEGKLDLVDLNIHAKEVNAGRASIQGGYSDVDGLLYGASINEPNFLGSGRAVAIGFQRSEYSSQYNFSYTNPFYTTYGMSRGFSIYYTHTTPGKVNLESYTTDSYGASMRYSVPISEFNYFSFGYGYSHIAIGNANPNIISPGAYQFLLLHPSPYNNFMANVGLVHSHLDRAIFPREGSLQQLNVALAVPILHSSLGFYKATFDAKWYWSLGHGFIVHPHVLLGYGDGYGGVNSLPFFSNFFGGGIETLLGYEPNTLGPQNPNETDAATGGNVETFAGLNLIFPNGITEKLRTSLYVAFGNIFQTHRTAGNPGNPGAGPTIYQSVSLKNIHGSAGLMVSWFSPIGIISVGYGIPFNVKGARVQQFGFTFGGSI